MPSLLRVASALGCTGLAAGAYGCLVERNAFVLRHFDVPVLDPGTRPVRLLHISDLHIMPNQHRKLAWIRELAELEPDLVINTGDHLSSLHGIPALMHALEPLFRFPGAFVPGNNDYYAPRMASPIKYFDPQKERTKGAALPWPVIATAISDAGWLDLTHARKSLTVGGVHGKPAVEVALAGTDDPHLGKARYDRIAGVADPAAAVRIGVIHSPEPNLLSAFAADRYDLVLAGHTHGGQVRVPFGPALVTNCGIDVRRARWLHQWDSRMWFHVCAGLGTSPFMPIRFACRPEASLLRLTPRPA